MASANQNVGFIGFVTRKDKDTGVNLLAKIVTPNKKRALNKLVRVKVKANALDDYSCCVIDHAAMKKIIEESQDLESVSESFQFLYNGENGTNISYAIEKLDESSQINKYLSEDGTLAGRPKYSPDGTADAIGYIRITVTKNDAEVSSRIMVRVKGMTADEVLNSDKIYSAYKGSLSEYLWDGIAIYDGTKNEPYSREGYTSISGPLMFNSMSSINVPEISDAPIECTWYVDYDDVAKFIDNSSGKFPDATLYDLTTGGKSRICMDKESADYGKIYQPTYKQTCSGLVDNKFASLIKTNANEARNRRFRIGKTDDNSATGKLRLRAKLTLGDAQPIEKVFMCATTSKPMSTDEVADFVKEIMQIGFNNSWMKCDNNPVAISIPDMDTNSEAAQDQIISVFGNGHYTNLSQAQYDQLQLDSLTLSNVVGMTNDPFIYSVVDTGSGPTISATPYGYTSRLFSSFVQKDGTNSSGDIVRDDIREITLSVGNKANKTGMYAAHDIINNYGDSTSFGLRFKVDIQKLNDGDEVTTIEFVKIFNLVQI